MTTPPPEPLFFGSAARPLFGWLHRPAPGSRLPLGVVLCNPFGYEAVSTHRTLKQFAQTLASAGIPAMRFDYDGTGDSVGSDRDPGRLAAWVSSVNQAADILRRGTGCERLVFLGIRLGATLAALASSQRLDVAGFIAIAPVVNAKAYMRELRALQMASRAADSSSPATGGGVDDDVEVTGFILTAQTRASLANVDLMKLEHAPAPNVLILDRHDLPGNERWADHLQSLGATVVRRAVPGYTEMMLSPHAVVVPTEMLRATADWLGSISATEVLTSRLTDSRTHVLGRSIELPAPDESHAAVTETALFLEPDQNVFGVLTQPKRSAASPPPLEHGILLLNAGGTHHIGPNRMYVTLARQWAAQGYAVLRIDFTGIGDSPPRPGEAENVIYTGRAADDIVQATNFMRKHVAVMKIHAMGLCSGAYHALKSAVGGAQLDSAIMINPLTFFWKEGMSLDEPLGEERVISEVQRYKKTAFSLMSWLKLLRGEVNVIRVARIFLRRVGSGLAYSWRNIARRLALPLTDDLGAELESVARRRIHMQFVFAAQDPGIELLRTQGGSSVEKLRRRKQLQIEVIGGADHTFTAHRAQGQLASALMNALRGGATR